MVAAQAHSSGARRQDPGVPEGSARAGARPPRTRMQWSWPLPGARRGDAHRLRAATAASAFFTRLRPDLLRPFVVHGRVALTKASFSAGDSFDTVTPRAATSLYMASSWR